MNAARRLLVIAVVLSLMLSFIPVGGAFADINPSTLTWSVQYMIDQSQTVLGVSQFTAPRDNRGLAISPDGRYLYAGYNNGPEVRKIDLTKADYTDATVARTAASRGKAITVDDQGRVYLADGGAITIIDANLSAVQYIITVTKCEGIAVRREGSTLALYATERGGPNTLTRWVLTESGGAITGATPAGLDGDGVITVAGASDMRGVAVDSSGRIWIADPSATTGNGMVFRLNSNGSGLVSNIAVPNPYAIAFSGNQALVTGGYQGVISVLDMDSLALVNTLTPPGADLKLAPDSGYAVGRSLSGIVTVSNGFYVTNEGGQTAGEKSTYGRTDAESGIVDGNFYTDRTHDDNDPILFASNPLPPSAGLSASDTTICVGDPTTINVNFANVDNLYGYELKVNFPTAGFTAVGAFDNSWFNTTVDAAVVPGWNGTPVGGVAKFAVSKQAGDPVSGSGTVAKVTLTATTAGSYDITISDVLLGDRDGNPINAVVSPDKVTVEVCGFATVSGKVNLQGRAAPPAGTLPPTSGTVTLADAGYGPYSATFNASGTFTINNVKVAPTGTNYTIAAAHGLYLSNQTTTGALLPLQVKTMPDTRLLGGDANNSGKIEIGDIGCIGGDFGLPPSNCGGAGSSDITADGTVNILDLVLAGGNYDLVSPQPW